MPRRGLPMWVVLGHTADKLEVDSLTDHIKKFNKVEKFIADTLQIDSLTIHAKKFNGSKKITETVLYAGGLA